jgi:hypothetical protein
MMIKQILAAAVLVASLATPSAPAQAYWRYHHHYYHHYYHHRCWGCWHRHHYWRRHYYHRYYY